jgi:hypothetical protein
VPLVDYNFLEAGCGQRFEVILDQRFAAKLDQGFGDLVRQRPQAFTTTGSEYHGAHLALSSN